MLKRISTNCVVNLDYLLSAYIGSRSKKDGRWSLIIHTGYNNEKINTDVIRFETLQEAELALDKLAKDESE